MFRAKLLTQEDRGTATNIYLLRETTAVTIDSHGLNPKFPPCKEGVSDDRGSLEKQLSLVGQNNTGPVSTSLGGGSLKLKSLSSDPDTLLSGTHWSKAQKNLSADGITWGHDNLEPVLSWHGEFPVKTKMCEMCCPVF